MKPTKERGKWWLFDDTGKHVDRFGLLLAVTALAVMTLLLVDLAPDVGSVTGEVAYIAMTVFVGAMLITSLRASGVARRYRAVAGGLVVFGVAATIVLVLIDVVRVAGDTPPAPSFLWVALAAAAPVFVVRRLFMHRSATIRTLLGAVSAYLLIAVAFDFAYLLVDVHGSERFFGSDEPTTSFMYYSLVTITTLGYGDLAATTVVGRFLSVLEAVIGQVYLVTIVAMIVGLMVSRRQNRHEPDEEARSA